ncbi:MAG: AraC family transcriptional regulator [bacterium]|jgi:AraC-like DNA-binding protein|nr:AraC family transcriptional regulator [bacterium]MDD3805557.1 AraC family transcriptional regulator [bacterium]MDD4558448.1 AraC family transcriptional regulator [bacterium]
MATPINRKETPVVEQIFSSGMAFPVKVCWRSGIRSRGILAYHGEMEIHFIKRGEGTYFITDNSYSYQKNHLVVIRPNAVHRAMPQPDSYMEQWSLFFPLFLFSANCNMPEQSCCLELDERAATEVEVIFRIIEEEDRRRDALWKEIIINQLERILLLAIRAGMKMGTRRPEKPLVKKLIGYIEEHFREELNLTVLKREFSYSPSYLSRVFKQCTGLNLHQYITQRRIAEAKRLLEEEEQKVEAISREVGFSDFSLFNRNFKRITGFTPSAYRKILHQDV